MKKRKFKYVGVRVVKSGKFMAKFSTKHIGTYATELEAAKARDAYVRRLENIPEGIEWNFPDDAA